MHVSSQRLSTALLERRHPLDPENASSRISAYIYGNIVVLAALIPLTPAEGQRWYAIPIVAGTAISTFAAHWFAETVGRTVRTGEDADRSERFAELRNSMPILSSAMLPMLLLCTGLFGWLDGGIAERLAQATVVLRLAGTAFVVRRLRGESPSRSTWIIAIALAAVAVGVASLKSVLTH